MQGIGLNLKANHSSGLHRGFFFLLLGVGMIVSCENSPEQIAEAGKVPEWPVETIRDLETLYSDSGKIKVRVRAPVYTKKIGNQVITELPQGIHIEFFDAEMQVESELSSEWAIHRENERVWEARKDVVVVNRKGERLNTEKLLWDERKERITSDQHVRITTSDEVIFGEGFEANQDFSNYRIFNVKGRLTIKK